MRLILTLLFSFICLSPYFAQEYEYEYNGVLVIDGEMSSPDFRILFNVKNGVIEGISYFKQSNSEVTQGRVAGTYNGSEIFFYEAEILPPVKPNFNYCLISLKSKVPLKNLRSDFNAEFIGYLNGNLSQICGSGQLMMTFDKPEEEEVQPTIIMVDTPTQPEEKGLQDAADIIFKTSDASLTMTIFDELPDYDRLSVYVDNELIHYNVLISTEPITITVKLNSQVKLIATSIGKSPPNTAQLKIQDNSRHEIYKLDIDLNNSVKILIDKN